ncbi:TetR family transcriptional regulator [Kaistia dalseonensis]|uniref:AcrR family transcriptional regulator n=1 Tax=Kaistia dalseonensis TaxID=410840 RepID=A0ABU0H6Y2_9HYPH|nr:TetR/AcrR family transcriptional regulator [Kaistia dalseonensis]MCX5495471.1 TetR family transcriptional regulator [Kaistia dalseonensis]MDQ0438062.1 AcrR family transcriptional regulator [Kaistia dalseonensis]
MSSQESFERVAQKQRTRATLLAATRELLAEGKHPTVAETADRAGISRATAYRYFSAPDAMAQEAVLDAIAREFTAVHFRDGPADADLAMRAESVVAGILAMVIAHEALFRTFLSVSVGGGGRQPAERGGRRMGWIEEALAPVSTDLSDEQMKRLIAGLALLTGIETIVVLKDVMGMDDAAAEKTARALARTLVQGVLAD